MKVSPYEEALLERLRQLPIERQQEVVRFVTLLLKETPPREGPWKSIEGLWADLGLQVTEEDIAEARREMWGGPTRARPTPVALAAPVPDAGVSR